MATQSTVGQRFTQLINHLGLSKNAFAMSLDKTATVIQHLVDERNKPGFDLLCKVFEVYPNVSKDWLLEGREPMLTNEAEAAVAAPETAVAPPARPAPEPAAPESAAASAPRAGQPAPAKAAPVPPAASADDAPPLVAPVAAPAPVAPAPVETPVAPAAAPQPAPLATAAPIAAATPDASWQAALYTQQMAHQLALAELRNQHLLDQQRLMQQMMDLMQRQLS